MNIYRAYMNLYGDIVHDSSPKPKPKPKFTVGDKVRMTKKQEVFHEEGLIA
jgi:hypothetical protein